MFRRRGDPPSQLLLLLFAAALISSRFERAWGYGCGSDDVTVANCFAYATRKSEWLASGTPSARPSRFLADRLASPRFPSRCRCPLLSLLTLPYRRVLCVLHELRWCFRAIGRRPA